MNITRKTYIYVVLVTLGFYGMIVQSAFDFKSSKFSTIAATSAFVDKTLLIRELMDNKKLSMIAAPPKFGKSTNLDMIKTFLEIEVGDNGYPKTSANYSVEPVKDTSNYKLFDDMSLKITKESIVMNEFFGRTPVLSVSFKCDREISSLDDAVNHFKHVMHQTFKQYHYLLKSVNLSPAHKQQIEAWCDEKDHKMYGKQCVTRALRELSEYLYRHFSERRVFVLLDNHDSVIRRAMFSVKNDDMLDDIIRFSVCIMNAVLKSNSRYVVSGLMTGVMDIPAFGTPEHNIDYEDSFQLYRFLGDHRFVDFYGLTKLEVEELLVKMKLGEEVDGFIEKYGGYQSVRGNQMYNLYSVLNFLEKRKFDVYWPNYCPLQNITEVIKIPFINKSLNKLLRGDSINVTVIKEIASDDIALLRDFVSVERVQKSYLSKKYLFFLVEKGYLSYASGVVCDSEDETNKIAIKIPNNEIKEYFSSFLKTQ